MSSINMGRVVVGGLVAGLVINVSEFVLNAVVLADDMNAAMAALNRPPIDNGMIVWFVLLAFGIGMMAVWVYAAVRPRFGPGVQTAICASLVVWGLAYLYPNVTTIVLGLFPTRLMIIATVWGLVEVLVAGVAGAWIYTEA
jgi:pimeloyl-ACP methyl ester carboxylesterase